MSADISTIRRQLENIMFILPEPERALVRAMLEALAAADGCVAAMEIIADTRPACRTAVNACAETLSEGMTEAMPYLDTVLQAAHEMRKDGTL